MRKSTIIPVATLLFAFTLLGGSLLMMPSANADSSASVDLTVIVPTACSLIAGENTLNKTIFPGTSDSIGTTGIQAFCNDMDGFAIYAAGYTGDEYRNNFLTTSLGDEYKIATGVAETPSNSQWYMKVEESDVAGTFDVNIVDGFGEDHEVPEYYEKIAFRNSITDDVVGANFNVTFGAYISPNQAAGTYQGKVKFLLLHPNVYGYDSVTSEPETFAPDSLEPPISFVLPEDVTIYRSRDKLNNPQVLPAGTVVTISQIDDDFVSISDGNGTSGVTMAWWIDGLDDALDIEKGTNMKVYIFSSRRPVMTAGEPVYLTSYLIGFEGYELAYVWECDKHDGNGWIEMNEKSEGEDHYEFPATAESLSWDWRLSVYYRTPSGS